MKQPETYWARGDGVRIRVAEWTGKGTPLLAIHGLTANCRCWDVAASGVAPENRFLAMDLRGRGLSDKPDTGYSIEHHCRDISAVISDLNLERVVLIGHSLGAFISLASAAKEPDRVGGLILIDGGAPLTPQRLARVSAALRPSIERLGKEFPSFEAYTENMKAAAYFEPWTETVENYFRYETEQVNGMFRSRIDPEHIKEESTNLATTDIASYCRRVRRPVLALAASDGLLSEEDLVMPDEGIEVLKELIPGSKVLRLEGTNHYSILFQPNVTRDRAVLDFVASL